MFAISHTNTKLPISVSLFMIGFALRLCLSDVQTFEKQTVGRTGQKDYNGRS